MLILVYVVDQATGQVISIRSSPITLVKTLLSAREVLLKELYRLSKAIDVEVDFTNYKILYNEATFLQSHFKKELETMKSDTASLGNLQLEPEVSSHHFVSHLASSMARVMFHFL